MTEFASHPEIDDELLSAYLDGELSDDERASVEARLNSDPSARQMLDQLKDASQAMKSLPREAVGHDLRESILRRAEAAMLASNGGQAAAAEPSVHPARDRTLQGGALPKMTIGRTRRGWVWAALALAAAVVIMVFQPADQQNGNLPEVAARKERESVDRFAVKDPANNSELRNLGEVPPLAEPQMAAGTASSATTESLPGANAPLGNAVGDPSHDTIALDRVATLRAPTAPRPSRDDTSVLADNETVATTSTSSLSKEVELAATPQQQVDSFGVATPLNGTGGRAKDVNGGPPPMDLSGPAAIASSGSERGPLETGRGSVRREIAPAAPAGGQVSADESNKAVVPASTEDLVVVHVVATPDALRRKAFDHLLTENGIRLDEQVDETSRLSVVDTWQSAEHLADRELDRAGGQTRERSGESSELDVVLVAAPKTKIEKCLADLKQDQESYLGVAVDYAQVSSAADGKDKSVAEAEPNIQELATDLGHRYNRGKFSPEIAQKRNLYYYDLSKNLAQAPAGGRGFSGGGALGGKVKQEQFDEEPLSRADGEILEQRAATQVGDGHARRLLNWRIDDQANPTSSLPRPAVAEGPASTSNARQPNSSRLTISEPLEQAGENLHVLFVLSRGAESPAGAPPSPPAENQQK